MTTLPQLTIENQHVSYFLNGGKLKGAMTINITTLSIMTNARVAFLLF